MCDDHTHDSRPHKAAQAHFKKKTGSTLADGQEHTREHHSWNRRDFLRLTGLATLGGSLLLNSTPLQAFAPNGLLQQLAMGDCGDRILVLLRLKGGNDGLNMLIPRNNDTYFNIRPNLAIPETGLWGLGDTHGMPNEMLSLQPFWEEGNMRVIHNVGYPDANYSHFRSSDIWASASDADEIVRTGWIGRWLDQEMSAFTSAAPVVPPALQIGVQTNMIFRAAATNMALSISNPDEFYRIALNGQLYDTEGLLPNLPQDRELGFTRGVANSAFRYSESIRDAYNGALNVVDYPQHYLGEHLGIVARLIKGNLGTKVYMVTIDGFDTHAEQADNHPVLLQAVADGVQAFFTDLRASGHAENVLMMTFSEFGRTIYENGSLGTDHGTGAPMLVFGEGIGNGFHGTPPDLDSVGDYGDPEFSVDFRSAYSTVLQNWLCVAPEVVNTTLGQVIAPIDGLLPASSPPPPLNRPGALLGHNPDPAEPGVIQLKYGLGRRGLVRLMIRSANGSDLRMLVNTTMEKGSYIFRLRPNQFYLLPGEYIYRLETGGKVYERVLTIN